VVSHLAVSKVRASRPDPGSIHHPYHSGKIDFAQMMSSDLRILSWREEEPKAIGNEDTIS
jgi:hypothetical protein